MSIIPSSPEAPSPHRLPQGLSLLLVEDDQELASIMTRWAEWVGATMDTAAIGGAALTLAASKSYDAVLLDLTLPDMEGAALYARLVEVRPTLASRTIILTGGAVTPGARAFLHHTPCPVVLKPFDLDCLGRQIAKLGKATA